MPFASVAAEEANNGVVNGQVTNVTDGGVSSTANVEVTLNTYDHTGIAEGDPIIVQTDEDGNFVFDTLATTSGNIYQMAVTFLGVDYTSDPFIFEADETTKTVDVDVYDTTGSDGEISIAMSWTQILTQNSILTVSEYYLIRNGGDTAYVGTDDVPGEDVKETLKFTLPAEATGLRYTLGLEDDSSFDTDDGFISAIAVPPGDTHIFFTYHIVPTTDEYDFSRKFHYPVTGGYSLLLEDMGGAKASSEQLTLEEPYTNEEGTKFIQLIGSGFSADSTIAAQLDDIFSTPSNLSTIIWAIVGSVLAAAAAGGAIYWRRKRSRRLAAIAGVTPHIPEDKRQKLLLEIAQLDDELVAGNISQEDHDKLRSEKKQLLVKLIRRPEVDSYGE
jgi:hypothetical protein